MEESMRSATLRLNKTKKGAIYLWESGGRIKGKIRSTIIADKNMEKKTPLYSTASETRDGYKYAKIPIIEGDLIVKVFCDYRFNLSIIIYRVVDIIEDFRSEKDELINKAVCDIIDSYNNGEWDNSEHLEYKDMINAALIQATRFSRDALFVKYTE